MAGPESPFSAAVERAAKGLATLSGVALLITLVLIFVSVILRYGFATPVVGVNEVVQLVSIGIVMLALPWCTARGSHVSVDVLDARIGPLGRFVGDIQYRIIAAFILGVLAWRACLKALDAWEFADETNMLQLPLWPFFGLMALGMALTVVVLLAQLVQIVKAGPK